jgi:cytochrome c oxidase subunit III
MSQTSPAAHVHKDPEAAKIGMWLFLFTELLLFGALFILYAAYRSRYTLDFHHAGQELNWVIGVANTVILLTSSLTMAMSLTALKRSERVRSLILIAATVLLALAFLVNKYFEWSAKIHHGIYPSSPELLSRAPGEVMFFGLYFTMTGLHGLHVAIGALVLTVMGVWVWQGRINAVDPVRLENAGLYWHLVDVIWIFLLPLFYLAA